jgi:O-antigen ligase
LDNGPSSQFTVQTTAAKTRLYWLIAAFLILAPVSVSGATSRDGDDLLKWARVTVLAVVTISGFRWLRWPRKGDVAGKLLLVAVVFCGAAIWSTSPLWGLAFKGMFVASVVAGISLANALRSEGDFRSFARAMTSTSVVAIVGLSYFAATQDAPIFHKGRVTIAQINPNLLAQSAAVFALLCLFHVLVRDSRRWIMTAMTCTGVMLALTILSGSRGAVLMLMAGLAVLMPAIGHNRRQTLVLTVVSIAGLSLLGSFWFTQVDTSDEFGTEVVDEETLELRIFRELTKDTRMTAWRAVTRTWSQHPVIGVGWLNRSNRWSTVQSAYLQVLVEAGIVGFVPLIVFLFAALRRIAMALRLARRTHGLPSQLSYIFSATLFALLFHAAFESSAVTGASPNAVLLGFCVAQLDQLVRLMTAQRREMRSAAQATEHSAAATALLTVAEGRRQ